MRICVQPSAVPSIEVNLKVEISQLAIRSARRRHHDDEWPVFADILFGVPLVLIRVEIDPAHQVEVLANGKLASDSQSRCPGLSSAEFADVKVRRESSQKNHGILNWQSNGLDVGIGVHIRVSNANEHGIAIEKVVLLIFGGVGVERLRVRKDAPKGILGQKVES